ncbi:DUF1918 domain-containing protein [Streptomyces sp. NPDC093225]|uniref:DUF1918 domain-containing protein n=1 Tax=Streptomyces sp. NPDC093225 TaxID=3366034 RepID=UPI003800C916
MNAMAPEYVTLHAEVGDQIVIGGPTVGSPGRDGEVIALHHPDGTPPYDVRWSDTGRTSVFFPGPDARIKHLHHRTSAPTDRIRSARPTAQGDRRT